MDGVATGVPGSRDGPRAPRDERRLPVTGGARGGTSGGRFRLPPVRAYVAIGAFLALVDVINIASTLYDAHRMGHVLAAWEPITWEFTSGAAQLISCCLIYWALELAPPGRTAWWRLAPVHLLAVGVYSGLHTGLMTLMRCGVYALAGRHYGLPPFNDWIYEYRKDVISYLVLGTMFWLLFRPGATGVAAETAASATATPDSFDIVDGPNVWRTPLEQILAVRAAGNYVEFLLQDGRRPLMRAALGEIEDSLGRAGFVRTHRSWLVNPASLRRLEAVGSGDYRLELAGGVEASLSRRFPDALERLKSFGSAVGG